jgi:hypothetical protein
MHIMYITCNKYIIYITCSMYIFYTVKAIDNINLRGIMCNR